MNRRILSAALLLLTSGPGLAPEVLSAQDAPEAGGIEVGPRIGYVHDYAEVIDPDSRNLMEDLSSEVRRKCKGDIVIVTLPSLHGRTPEDVASELTALWDVGYQGASDDPATDTGVLVILSIQDREFSIQVQEGVEAFFPDAAIRELVTTKAIEPFRAGEYGVGLAETVRGLAQVFAQRFQFQLETGS